MLVLVLGRCFGSAIRDEKNTNISKTNRQYRSRVQATSAFHHKHTVVMETGPDDAIGMPSSGRVLSSRRYVHTTGTRMCKIDFFMTIYNMCKIDAREGIQNFGDSTTNGLGDMAKNRELE